MSCRMEHELMKQLRPKNSAELHSLLQLCQASVAIPAVSTGTGYQNSFAGYNGVAHFVKNRHGPYFALMSILCHLSGKNSPAYWDLFRESAGRTEGKVRSKLMVIDVSSGQLAVA